MKRLWVILFALLFSLFAGSCGVGQQEQDGPSAVDEKDSLEPRVEEPKTVYEASESEDVDKEDQRSEPLVTEMPDIDTGPDFRSVKWGMNKEEVKKIETARYQRSAKVNNEEIVLYRHKLFDKYDCSIIYQFGENNKLVIALYALGGLENRYITYNEIMPLLVEKYGKPSEEGQYNAIWHADNCTIGILFTEGYDSMAIMYFNPKYYEEIVKQGLEEKNKKKEEL